MISLCKPQESARRVTDLVICQARAIGYVDKRLVWLVKNSTNMQSLHCQNKKPVKFGAERHTLDNIESILLLDFQSRK